MSKKNPVSYRLSSGAVEIIKNLAENLGVSQAAIIEMAVRKLAQREAMENQDDKETSS